MPQINEIETYVQNLFMIVLDRLEIPSPFKNKKLYDLCNFSTRIITEKEKRAILEKSKKSFHLRESTMKKNRARKCDSQVMPLNTTANFDFSDLNAYGIFNTNMQRSPRIISLDGSGSQSHVISQVNNEFNYYQRDNNAFSNLMLNNTLNENIIHIDDNGIKINIKRKNKIYY